MQLFRNLILVICFSPAMLSVYSQQNKQVDSNTQQLFGDLPLFDPSTNSVLQQDENAAEKITKNIWVKAVLNKHTAYVGEPVLLTYLLYTALNSVSEISARPSLQDFSTAEVESLDSIAVQNHIGAKTYRVFTIWEVQLNPFQVGQLDIGPMVVQNRVSYVGSDNKTRTYSGAVTSKEVQLTVVPLPPKDRPSDFSGAVGKYDIKTDVEKQTIEAGENNSLRVEIEGSGVLDNISLPTISWPTGIEHYMISDSTVASKDKFPTTSKKIFHIPFVAKGIGVITIPQLALSYFNPLSKKYAIAASSPITLHVTAGHDPQKVEKPVAAIDATSGKRRGFIWWTLIGSFFAGLGVFLILRRNLMHKKIAAREMAEQARLAAQQLAENQEPDYLQALADLAFVEDDNLYLEKSKLLLINILQFKCRTKLISEEDLLQVLHEQTGGGVLVEEVKEVFTFCNRSLYAPNDFEDIRVTIATAIGAIIERTQNADKLEIESEQINRVPGRET